MIFRGSPGFSQSQSRPKVEGDLGGIWGPVTGLHQQDKQIYRCKEVDLETVDQLTCKQQITDL